MKSLTSEKNFMILDKIISHKKKEIQLLKRRLPLALLKKQIKPVPEKRRFLRALEKAQSMAVIAEIKKRSPSKGILRKNFKPAELARAFEAAGAVALSVLTDGKFFGGSAQILKKVRAATKLPILRKDFILDEYQVYEARQIGADAILLIAAILSREKLKTLSALAERLGLDVLFELHSEADIRNISTLKPRLVGINNRDLRTFRVDLKTTDRLRKKLPRGSFFVSESGIQTPQDVRTLQKIGVKAVLVGEGLMKEKDPGAALQRLLGKLRDSR